MWLYNSFPGAIYISGDGIRPSVPWRLGKSPNDRALTAEQEASLASRFGLDPTMMRDLSKTLGHMLDPAQTPIRIPVHRAVAEERGEAVVRRALQEVTKTKERLTAQLQELERLNVPLRAPAEGSAPFRQGRESLANVLVLLQQAQDGLQRTLEIPGTVRVDRPTDKRLVSDQRRLIVLHVIFTAWHAAGRPMTYTTTGEDQRSGPLIEFARAVVTCVTEPPRALPGETIKQELKAFLEFNSRFEASGSPDNTPKGFDRSR